MDKNYLLNNVQVEYLKAMNDIISDGNADDIFKIPTKDEFFKYNEEDDIKYLSHVEVMKTSIRKQFYNEKPKCLKKSIYFKDACMKKISSICGFVVISPIEVYYKMLYDSFHNISHDEDKCSICLDLLYDFSKEYTIDEVIKVEDRFGYDFNVILLEKCSDHFFHVKCISLMIGNNSFIKCPVCSMIYGILKGTQPDGTMIAYIDKNIKCSSYEKYDTIVIYYNFPNGRSYSGTSRYAYLPNNSEGRKILGLLKIFFDRRLIFTVGTSVTTGRSNTTVWAGIHHKTNLSGGTAMFGYPDSSYFNRVREEMAAKGVVESLLNEPAEVIADTLLKLCKKI